MVKQLLTRKEIESFGFIYEPDVSKCRTLKLKLYVPKKIDDFYKKEIAKQIPFKYIHKVWETPNPYGDNPSFLADPKVLVMGHGQIDLL